MFDAHARTLIDQLPELPGLDRVACRRALSEAYLYVVRTRLNANQQPQNIEIDAPDNLIHEDQGAAAESEDEASSDDMDEALYLLRRMADSLESVAVFDRLYGVERGQDVENASAFVAAEALALLAQLSPDIYPNNEDPLLNEAIYSTVEAALLYLIGDYVPNALTVIQKLPQIKGDQGSSLPEIQQNNASYVLSRIEDLCRGRLAQPRSGVLLLLPSDFVSPDRASLLIELRIRFYIRIGKALDAFLDWLGQYDVEGIDKAITELEAVRRTASSHHPRIGYNTTYSDIYHLSALLLAVIDRTRPRALIYHIPRPPTDNPKFQKQFEEYIERRARGSYEQAGRPILWPSTREYIEKCLPGPYRNAVISMPTGSGKSFIAELAISHALATGWVLYLAPTNALVHQIRRDLDAALNVPIRAFIGRSEYTSLAGEQIALSNSGFVAVMTPEKCTLAMRLHPESFTNCSLCIFDECHLLADKGRGVITDLLLAQLPLLASEIRFLLMSAMVSNPEELAEWLSTITPRESAPLTIQWRPSRALRGVLALDEAQLRARYEEARAELSRLPAKRKQHPFSTPLHLLVGLSGPWTLDGRLDYRVAELPTPFEVTARRDSDQAEFDSWKNPAATLIAEDLAQAGIPTICFIMTSRHHAFSSANQIAAVRDSIVPHNILPPLVEAWLGVAEAELGVETVLRELLSKGIAVHTSDLLTPERTAAEWMFSHKKANLMFATGTLAQGLNLPAIAVVIAGTSMGDARDQDLDRATGLILNAFGRAGRPGFANQGVAILVPDNPVYINTRLATLLRAYPVLRQQDAAIRVESQVSSLLDQLLSQPQIEGGFDDILPLIIEPSATDVGVGDVLSRTFGAYQYRRKHPDFSLIAAEAQIERVRARLLHHDDSCPQWILSVAARAGVPFIYAWRMWQSYKQRGVVPPDERSRYDVKGWLAIFFDVMSYLPPALIRHYFPSSRTTSLLTKLRDANLVHHSSIPWPEPANWRNLWAEFHRFVLAYMEGQTYAQLAQLYLYLPPNKIDGRRTLGKQAIPAITTVIKEFISRLAIDAGCFLAINEFLWNEEEPDALAPESLQALPLCIRHGCDSLETFSWYLFGYRQRVIAHEFAQRFPIPDHLITQVEREERVRQIYKEWRRTDDEPSPLLTHLKTIVTLSTELPAD